jgi:hypothetical protein
VQTTVLGSDYSESIECSRWAHEREVRQVFRAIRSFYCIVVDAIPEFCSITSEAGPPRARKQMQIPAGSSRKRQREDFVLFDDGTLIVSSGLSIMLFLSSDCQCTSPMVGPVAGSFCKRC